MERVSSRVQRREGFRLEWARAARITTDDGRSGLARVQDLSEVGSSVTALAEVVRRDHGGALGVHFVDLPEHQADQIRAHLFSEQLARRGPRWTGSGERPSWPMRPSA